MSQLSRLRTKIRLQLMLPKYASGKSQITPSTGRQASRPKKNNHMRDYEGHTLPQHTKLEQQKPIHIVAKDVYCAQNQKRINPQRRSQRNVGLNVHSAINLALQSRLVLIQKSISSALPTLVIEITVVKQCLSQSCVAHSSSTLSINWIFEIAL